MASLTKTQINYLENKLSRAVDEKISNFKKEMGSTSSLDKTIAEKLLNGEIKLASKSDIMKMIKEKSSSNYSYYNITLYVNDLIAEEDKKRIENEINEREKTIQERSRKLYALKQNILDKIVLEGVDVDTAMAELENA